MRYNLGVFQRDRVASPEAPRVIVANDGDAIFTAIRLTRLTRGAAVIPCYAVIRNGGDQMEEQKSGEVTPNRLVPALIAIIGVLSGILIAVSIMWFKQPSESQTHEQQASADQQAPVAPQRWRIWDEGAGPLIGDAFKSEAECESTRVDLVRATEENANASLKNLKITYGQIQALGYNPADRIMEGVDHARRAYCKLT